MGGDFYPQNPVLGAIAAVRAHKADVILVGDQSRIRQELARYRFDYRKLEIVNAAETVEMSDGVINALRKKKHSSMRICFDLVKSGAADGVVSAGNSGAMLAIGHYVLKTVAGVDRPCISALLPSNKHTVLLVDAGANVDCSPQNLLQFAILGSSYREAIHGINHPKIGLLNIGSEEGKGDERSKITYHLLKQSSLNFIGNIEGKEFFSADVDVVVTDGFAGNVLLKSVQGAADFVKRLFKAEIDRSLLARFGSLLMAGAYNRLKSRTDYAHFGGAPLLGLRGNAIVCHGSSNPQAIAFGIRFSQWAHQCRLKEKLEEALLSHQLLLSQTHLNNQIPKQPSCDPVAP